MIVTLIEKVYSFLWGDLVQIPLPGGSTLGISLLIILLIPTGIYFTVRTAAVTSVQRIFFFIKLCQCRFNKSC